MTNNQPPLLANRLCLREPIPEIAEAARNLDAAVSAHLAGRRDLAEPLIRLADLPVIREWTESLWGKASPHVQRRVIAGAPPHLPESERIPVRMPNPAEQRLLHQRDGYHCRFCGIPVIRAAIRKAMQLAYPSAVSWGRTNQSQHAGFQAMWATYDHVLPHARGGDNGAANVIVTCQACNCARWHYTLEETGLSDPRTREPVRSSWDGLERFRQKRQGHPE